MVRSVVVLPAPLAPTNATISPSPRCRSTSCRMRIRPYPAHTFSRVSMRGLLTEVGVDDAGIAGDVLGGAGGQHTSLVEDEHTVGQPHHRGHDVFDEQQRHTVAFPQF